MRERRVLPARLLLCLLPGKFSYSKLLYLLNCDQKAKACSTTNLMSTSTAENLRPSALRSQKYNNAGITQELEIAQ